MTVDSITSIDRSLPEIDGLSKETVLASWMAKFDCIFKGRYFDPLGVYNDVHDISCEYLNKAVNLASMMIAFFFHVKVSEDDGKRPSRMQQQILNSEAILSKEQLYDMFQQILGIKKFEHQLLYNALQVKFSLKQNFY